MALELRPDRLELFGGVIAAARAGRPSALCIEGASGTGKTSHVRALLRLADSFRVLRAGGVEAAYRPPHGVLEQLGVPRTVTDDGAPQSALAAAQSLRRLIDGASVDEPLLIVVDDAQWADTESLEALRLVVERVSGDCMLVVVATRADPDGGDAPLRRSLRQIDSCSTLVLDGIDLSEAMALAAESRPDGRAPAALVERLWLHSERNPMYLRSLLAQYSFDDLSGMTEFPAPVEVARELSARLAALDADAVRFLRAMAIVGSSWVNRLDAAEIAQIDRSSAATELLLADGLLVARPGGPLSDVRIVHALVRAAVYQSIPSQERRTAHLRASRVLASPMQRLEHEVAAAERHDAALAGRLEQQAADSRAVRDHRREVQLLHWASQLAETPEERERLWLDSQLATILARDTRAVRANLSEIAWTGDAARRALVIAWLLIAENRIADARRTLEAVAPDALDQADAVTRGRILVLKAWTMLVSGYPTEEIRSVLDSLPAGAESEPASRMYYLLTAGQVASREFDFDHIRRDFDAAPLHVHETPMEDTDRLAWRGAVYSLCGFAEEARRDLAEVVSRIRGGRVDAGSGSSHALYGLSLWYDGEFDRCQVELQAAADSALDRLGPMVQAMLPLVPTVRGDFARADALLAESEQVLRDLPWDEAVSVLTQSQIVRLHAGGDEASRRGYLSRLRSVFGVGAPDSSNGKGAIWHLHLALARVWAEELDEVEGHLRAIETDMIVPGWIAWVRPWLSGLRTEEAGDAGRARELLVQAVGALDAGLPLYAAHLHADLCRLETRLGHDRPAVEAAAEARRRYSRLGATAYLSRLPEPRDAPSAHADVMGALSEREREVAALLSSGFSYAQIAEELYVTRSTVAFHLSRIYAKTGVGSRHELTRLMREGR